MAKEQLIQNEVTTGEPLEKGGYFVAYNLVIRNAMRVFNLTSGEFNLLTILFSYAGADKDHCFPSQDALAHDLNTTSRTVRRYLDGLLNKGVIDIYNRQNKYNRKITNVYDLSPCLHKIREIFCSEEQTTENDIKISKKPRNDGQDRSVLSETMDRTDLSGQIGQNCPTTNNNIQITDKSINHNNDYIDDDKRTPQQVAEDSPTHDEESINLIISNLREATKNDLRESSFKAVVKKVIDKYNQDKIGVGNFRSYLVAALANKIEELEERKEKDRHKAKIKESKEERIQKKREQLEQQPIRQDVPKEDWFKVFSELVRA